MSEEQSNIVHLWDAHWTTAACDVTSILQDRFTVEAYRRLSAFVTRSDPVVLEAGCGTGRFSVLLARQFPRSRVIGIDVSAEAVARAQKLSVALECKNVCFQRASLFALPFPDNYFDFVFNEGVLMLFSLESALTYHDAIREMVRVAKPGGKVLVSVANWNCFPHTFYKWYLQLRSRRYEYGYEKSFKHSELSQLLTEHGLKDLEFSGFYPSYGFYRLQRSDSGLFKWVFRALGRVVDRLDYPWLSGTFGFQIMAAGTK